MITMKIFLYLLAVLTCLACTVLLVREYARTRARLLLWSALCFVGLSLNNILLFVDMAMLPNLDLRVVRLLAALAGMMFLLYAFIFEADA